MPQLPRPRIALYPGSFDLLTNGHMDIITRSRKMFDQLVVAVGINPGKAGFFSAEERVSILRQATAGYDNVEVHSFNGLTVEYAVTVGAQFIVRGLRAVSDFDFELQLAIMNHQLNASVETIFLAAEPAHIFLSSSTIRDVWRHGGDVSEFVPQAVAEALKNKAKG